MSQSSPGMQTDQVSLERNQDPLRSTVMDLSAEVVATRLSWIRDDGPMPPPLSVQLDLTLRCTARCVHCSQWQWPLHEELTLDQLVLIVDVFKDWNVRTLTLSGGNPLLFPHLEDVLEIIGSSGIVAGLITEGAPLSHSTTKAISEHLAWIRFSLDGPASEIHDKVRNRAGLFAQVVRNIRELKSVDSSLDVGVNCVIQKANYRHLGRIVALSEELGLDTLSFKLPHGPDPKRRYLLSGCEWEEVLNCLRRISLAEISVRTNLSQLENLIDGAYSIQDLAQGSPTLSLYKEKGVRCFVPLFHLICDSEGGVYPCCYLHADNRQWDPLYNQMRSEFFLGNLLEGPGRVLANLRSLYRRSISRLPAQGYEACGSCTRHCQMNVSLEGVYNELGERDFSEEAVASSLGMPDPPGSSGRVFF